MPDTYDSGFEAAIRTGDAGRVSTIIHSMPDMVKAGYLGQSYLHYAAGYAGAERRTIVSVLLQHGIPVDVLGDDGYTALHNAALHGDPGVVRVLLAAGAMVDGIVTVRSSPLIGAAIEGHREVAALLLESGADLHRESLRTPLTPLGFANYYRVKNTGQDEVAEYLVSKGAIDPFNGPEVDWSGMRGQAQVEAVEATLGRVHPVPYVRDGDVAGVDQVTVFRTRFVAQKYLFQLLFTTDLALVTGYELAVCLLSTWPMHKGALEQATFRWPLDLLFHWAGEAVAGRGFAHGEVVDATSSRDAGVNVPTKLAQWLACNHASFELARERRLGAAPMLLLVPHLLKTPLKPGKQARERADKKYELLWNPSAARTGRNSLVVPQCFDAPWLGDNFLRPRG